VQQRAATYRAAGAVIGSNTIMLSPDVATAQRARRVPEAAMPGCPGKEGAS
jgi:hypothetical protein